ncbi:hypothetical protein, partial [Rhodoferax sp.]|uniref:hypothetical protein n=1 Tax=Rhodoferax sp. TaxID=50421 RepID=UPI00272540AB
RDHHNAQPHTKTRTGFDRSDQTVDSVWKQKNQGFHWENSAFLGRNFRVVESAKRSQTQLANVTTSMAPDRNNPGFVPVPERKG